MINLLQSEYKKYKNTYIYSLGLLGMISPVILIAISTFMVRMTLLHRNLYLALLLRKVGSIFCVFNWAAAYFIYCNKCGYT